jgi:hypothetical protein
MVLVVVLRTTQVADLYYTMHCFILVALFLKHSYVFVIYFSSLLIFSVITCLHHFAFISNHCAISSNSIIVDENSNSVFHQQLFIFVNYIANTATIRIRSFCTRIELN